MEDTTHSHDLSRRGVLRGAAVAGLTLPVLAACSSDSGSADGAEPTASAQGGAGSEGSSGGGGGTTVAAADVPVGGGTVLGEQEVVITQPEKGDFRAFSAVCTHQGCLVQSISDGTINCPCHGSAFSIEDGSVVTGPAQAPLPTKKVSVEGDQISVS
jgi:Rieske Fe-S protein